MNPNFGNRAYKLYKYFVHSGLTSVTISHRLTSFVAVQNEVLNLTPDISVPAARDCELPPACLSNLLQELYDKECFRIPPLCHLASSDVSHLLLFWISDVLCAQMSV